MKAWCARGTRPRDVLILVRQRGPLFEAVIRALKREGIAVAGADRLVLTEHIAVMDLLVLGDALLLPDDDLALATVLKSPLFGLDDEQLYTLAYGRKAPLRAALRAKAGDDPAFAEAAARSTNSRPRRARCTPFAFYAHVLGARERPQAISSRGSASRPPIRSTNSSISRSIMSGARRRRCKASSTGCARRKAKSSATWRWRATKCA